jgi:hypothetical protein
MAAGAGCKHLITLRSTRRMPMLGRNGERAPTSFSYAQEQHLKPQTAAFAWPQCQTEAATNFMRF